MPFSDADIQRCNRPCSAVGLSVGHILLFYVFLSATEYHSDEDYNSRQVGVVVVNVIVFVVVVVVVDHNFKNGLTFEQVKNMHTFGIFQTIWLKLGM